MEARSLIPATNRSRTWIGYLAMLVLATGVFVVVRHFGEPLTAGLPAVPTKTGAVAQHSNLGGLMLAMAAITLLARFMGACFRRILGQPPVMGEIVAGMLLGPSVLGAIAPNAYTFLLPSTVAPHLGSMANIGVVLFMFLVGLELDPKLLKGNTHATIAISHASIVFPFLLGTSLAVWLYPRYGTSNVSFTVFALFAGVALSVTAFPVLARILTDRGVQRTPLGVTALACAAVDDVSAWILLAIIVGIANAKIESSLMMIPWVALYLGVMFVMVRPFFKLLSSFEERSVHPIRHTSLALVFVALLLSAVATETIGIHTLFGAFLLGVLLPHTGRLAVQLRARIEDIVVVLFLPAFFAFSGMRTEIGLLSGAGDWLACGVIIVVATLGKFGGSFVAARFSGMGTRESAALGVLMNTRGLMQLIVLNIGLDLGVISPTLFAMLMIMALVTTFATTPVLNWIMGEQGFTGASEQLLDRTQSAGRLR